MNLNTVPALVATPVIFYLQPVDNWDDPGTPSASVVSGRSLSGLPTIVNLTNDEQVTNANASCCTLRPRTTPSLEENSMLGVIYGVLLWADMNAATPGGGAQRSCQPAVKPHILPLVWNFPLGKGLYGAAGCSSWHLPSSTWYGRRPVMNADRVGAHHRKV